VDVARRGLCPQGVDHVRALLLARNLAPNIPKIA
jgi:hypothetical protein